MMKDILVPAFLLASVFSFVWIALLQCCAPCIVWCTIFVLFLLLLLLTLVCGCFAGYTHSPFHGHDFHCDPGAYQREFQISFWIMLALTVLNVLGVCCMARRICLAVGILRCAGPHCATLSQLYKVFTNGFVIAATGQAISTMPMLVIFPFIPLVGYLCFAAFWIYACLY
jgi:hypothetical protein